MYNKYVTNGHIVAFGNIGAGIPIDNDEYSTLLERIANKPQAEEGYAYMLRADNLEWELVPLPESEEPTEEESTPAWDISQGEWIAEGQQLEVNSEGYEAIQGHFAAWNKRPPTGELWEEYWRRIY